jgi:hypothetical protein
MTLQFPQRRQDQLIQIGPWHGYRIEGDHAFINAEIHVPAYHSGGEWTLELWATEQPYREGSLTGVRVAQIALELPTPIGLYVHRVDTRTAAHLPLQGRAYAMALALIEHGPDGETSVHAVANYAEPQTFVAPSFEGKVGYDVQGREVVLQADGIFNPRPDANLSGTLSIELWAFPVSGSSTEGLRLAVSELERLAGGCELPAIERRVAFNEPPVGRYQLALLLCEWTLAHGYVARDRRDFGAIYEHAAPELPASSQALPPVAVPVAPAAAVVAVPAPVPAPARPVDRLRLVSPAAPAAAAAAEPEARAPAEIATKPQVAGPVSIQTADVEQLARVKGLNLKLAKEIVKARPFTSVADLIRVRGLGQKTIDRLKGLVTV